MIGTNVGFAAELLHSGNLVAMPTETVYGLAANALDDLAVAKIFEVKQRPSFDPLIVHMASTQQLNFYATDIAQDAFKLAEAFWPGPLTLVLKKHKQISDLVSAGLPTVGLRVPNHPLALQLLKECKLPLAAPSANPFGFVSPTSARHVANQLEDKISYILDGGNCAVGLESTIIDLSVSEPVILRLGGLDVSQIDEVIGKKIKLQTSSSNPKAPGMLIKHYAPNVPLMLGNINDLFQNRQTDNFGILSFSNSFNHLKPKASEILSTNGNINEAAANLFGALRRISDWNVDVVFAEKVPNVGLGMAINDRLTRASV